MSDLIDRQNLREQLNELCDKLCPYNEPTKAIGVCCASCAIDDVIEIVQNLPSAEPRYIATIQLSQEQLDEAFEKVKADILSVKPKTGEWIKETKHHKDQYQEFDYYTIRCSVCGDRPEKAWHLTPFCPNCGSRMLEEGGEDDE